ncbi:MAG: enoyl-CoA hydratase-related protein [Acidimicrobiales bacterium]|nr:enoyl-CoA hydratase-related protein [Acidimicrobiales bacterium]
MTEVAHDYETLLVDDDEGVRTITLHRPPRNEFTWQLGGELNQAFAAAEADDSVRVVIVTGSGDFFCAGAALGRQRDGSGASAAGQRPSADAPRIKPWEMSTPIIGAINGPAVGVGLTLPLQWDIRIAAEDAKMGLVFIRRGWIPELGAHWLLPRLVGMSNAMDLLLTGRIFTGAEAAEMGLVSQALPAADVLPAALDKAHQIAGKCAPVSVALSKRLAWQMLEETDHAAAQATDGELYRWTTQQPDSREGVSSFLEKRTPQWTMSKTGDLPPDFG